MSSHRQPIKRASQPTNPFIAMHCNSYLSFKTQWISLSVMVSNTALCVKDYWPMTHCPRWHVCYQCYQLRMAALFNTKNDFQSWVIFKCTLTCWCTDACGCFWRIFSGSCLDVEIPGLYLQGMGSYFSCKWKEMFLAFDLWCNKKTPNLSCGCVRYWAIRGSKAVGSKLTSFPFSTFS